MSRITVEDPPISSFCHELTVLDARKWSTCKAVVTVCFLTKCWSDKRNPNIKISKCMYSMTGESNLNLSL